MKPEEIKAAFRVAYDFAAKYYAVYAGLKANATVLNIFLDDLTTDALKTANDNGNGDLLCGLLAAVFQDIADEAGAVIRNARKTANRT